MKKEEVFQLITGYILCQKNHSYKQKKGLTIWRFKINVIPRVEGKEFRKKEIASVTSSQQKMFYSKQN